VTPKLELGLNGFFNAYGKTLVENRPEGDRS
jgi:hypothetical protein